MSRIVRDIGMIEVLKAPQEGVPDVEEFPQRPPEVFDQHRPVVAPALRLRGRCRHRRLGRPWCPTLHLVPLLLLPELPLADDLESPA